MGHASRHGATPPPQSTGGLVPCPPARPCKHARNGSRTISTDDSPNLPATLSALQGVAPRCLEGPRCAASNDIAAPRGQRHGRLLPLGHVCRGVFTPRAVGKLRLRRLWTGVEPATARSWTWCSTQLSYHEPTSPRFRSPARNTPSPTARRRGRRAAGPTRSAARLQRDAGGSRTHFRPVCSRPPDRLAPASCRSVNTLATSRLKNGPMSPPGVEPGPRPPQSRVHPPHPGDRIL